MPETPDRALSAWPRILGGAAIALLAVTLVWAEIEGDFLADGGRLLDNPWGVATLVEVYVAFMLFAGWICTRERRAAAAALWIVALALVGGIVSGIYVLRAAHQARGSAHRFWLGS